MACPERSCFLQSQSDQYQHPDVEAGHQVEYDGGEGQEALPDHFYVDTQQHKHQQTDTHSEEHSLHDSG